MKETHILNEELKRFEPIGNTCGFCRGGVSTKEEEDYYYPLFKETDRTNIVVYKSVKFKKIDIGTSRCSRCYKIHKQNLLYGRVVALLLVLFPALLLGQISIVYGFFYAVPAAIFMLSLVPRVVADWSTKSEDIRTEKEGVLANNLVKKMLSDGWVFYQPTA